MPKRLPTLDLHHLSHEEAEKKIIEFINFLEPPFKIITGKTAEMRKIACDIVTEYGWYYHDEYYYNYGCIVVMKEDI